MAMCIIFKLLSWSSLITVFMTNYNYGQSLFVMDTFSREKETILLREILQLVKNQARKMQMLERELTSINDKLSKCLSISRTFPPGHNDEKLLHSKETSTKTPKILQEQSTILEINTTIQLTSEFDNSFNTMDEETQNIQDPISTTNAAKSTGDGMTFPFPISTSSLLSPITVRLGTITVRPGTTTVTPGTTTVTSETTTVTPETTTVTPGNTKEPTTIGSRGKEFLILFMKNVFKRNLTVYITANNETTIKISTFPHLKAKIISANNFTSNFTLTLPPDLVCEYFTVEHKGLTLKTSELSTVTIFDSFDPYTNDGTLIIPTEKLSNRYIIPSTDPRSTSSYHYSQFAIGALYNKTNVENTFKFKANTPLTIQGKTYRDGDNFTVMLERFDTLQIGHTTDLSGSFITSTKPIAVFSGNRCQAFKTSDCSHMVTQLPPTTEFDTQYIVPPFYNSAGTLIQVVSENRSSINSSVGSRVLNFHLNEKGYKNIEITSNTAEVIESVQSVLVTAFGMGDPYMTVVPGIHQYLDYYKVIVPEGYEENFICVIVPSESLNNLRINECSGSHYTSVYQSAVTLTKQFSIRTLKIQS